VLNSQAAPGLGWGGEHFVHRVVAPAVSGADIPCYNVPSILEIRSGEGDRMARLSKMRLQGEGGTTMGLKAPGILTFMTSVILTVAVLFVWLFDAKIPLLELEGPGLLVGLLLAQMVLILGCTMRGL
jgi:hypothetical protein